MKNLDNRPGYREAREIAKKIKPGAFRRSKTANGPSKYFGFKDHRGESWVFADSINDLPDPQAWVNGKPARRVS